MTHRGENNKKMKDLRQITLGESEIASEERKEFISTQPESKNMYTTTESLGSGAQSNKFKKKVFITIYNIIEDFRKRFRKICEIKDFSEKHYFRSKINKNNTFLLYSCYK